jgi:hypothetical protein
MRTLLLAVAFLTHCAPHAQTPAAVPSHIPSDLEQSLTGNWTGVLEYRDYSEPATSTKRVQLPTWLSITPANSAQTWHYLYDDGPTKTVEETDTITFDPTGSTYTESDNGKPPHTFKVTGYPELRAGRGQLVFLGSGTENGKAAETRITLTIRRNLLTILEETRPAGSTDPFAFRHSFCFTRATPPPAQSSAK